MKDLSTEVFKSSIRIGDTVCITKEGGNNELIQGQVHQILPTELEGVRVEVVLDTQHEEFQVKEIGFVEYVVR